MILFYILVAACIFSILISTAIIVSSDDNKAVRVCIFVSIFCLAILIGELSMYSAEKKVYYANEFDIESMMKEPEIAANLHMLPLGPWATDKASCLVHQRESLNFFNIQICKENEWFFRSYKTGGNSQSYSELANGEYGKYALDK